MKISPFPARLFSVLSLCALFSSGALAADPKHNFSKWEPEIQAFEAQDRTNPPPRNAVLFIGSSTVRMWKTLATDFPEYHVINRGFGGSEIVDSTHFADRIIFPYRPRLIVLRAGGNDLWAGKSAGQVFDDFKDFVRTVHAKLPRTDIVFLSWSPTNSRWSQEAKERALNASVADFAQKNKRVYYLDAWDVAVGADGKPRPELFRNDQLHFNADGYKLLAKRVRPYLDSHFPPHQTN